MKPRIPTLRQSAATRRNWSLLRLKQAAQTLKGFLPADDTARFLLDGIAEAGQKEIDRAWKAELERIKTNESRP